MSYSQMVLGATVFSFMITAVNLLPPLLITFQQRYKERFGQTTRELDKFFVHLKVPYILGLSIVGGIVLGLLTGSWVLAGALAITGLFVPKMVMAVWKQFRTSQFELQLMDALILINNALRSGLDISTGIELVATNMKPPISEEFGTVLNAYRLGSSLDGALAEMSKRIQSRPLDTAIGAIIIQRETGGNLIKTFDQLVQTIREESKLQKKVRALSAQGRTQIMFLAAFPWLLAALFYVLSPDMFRPAMADPRGQAIIIGMVVWECIGLLVTKRIVTVDV